MWRFSVSWVIYFHGSDVTCRLRIYEIEISERHPGFLVGFPECSRFRTAICWVDEAAWKPPQPARNLSRFLNEENFFFVLYYRHVHRVEGDREIYFVHILYFSCNSFGKRFFIN